jgi:signal transduction histidine kinase
MNFYLEPSLNAVGAQSTSTRDAIGWAIERIQKSFRRQDAQQLDRELKLRLDERRKERDRIARELHDTLFQGFLGASVILQGAVEQTSADSPTRASLNRVLQLMHRAIDEGRHALQELRSSARASLSLEESLYALWEELAPAGVRFRILVEGAPKALKPAIQEQLFLIGREAILNALRHSGASNVEAVIEYSPRYLRLVVRDDGCGIDPQMISSGRDLHWGLQGMRERAATVGAHLRIWSKLGGGTEVEVSLPVKAVTEVRASLSSLSAQA